MLINLSSKIIVYHFLIILFLNCSKGDKVSPDIIIQTPLENDSFQIPTLFYVKGIVTDDNLQRLEVDIVSGNSSSIIQKVEVELDSSHYEFSIPLLIDDRLLSSGSYFVNIKAFDKNQNVSSKYISILLNEVPRTLESLFYITSANSQTYIYELDSTGSLQLRKQINGNHKFSIVNSRHQYLFFATDQVGESIEINGFTNIWDISTGPSLYPLFIDVSKTDDGDQLHLVTGDGRILSCNKNGNIINNIYSNPQEKFGRFNIQENIVLVESYSSFLDRDLVVYFRESGIEKQRTEIQGEIIKIIPLSNNNFILLSHFQNDSKFSTYYQNSNQLFPEIEISNCLIYDAFNRHGEIVLTTSKGIYTYDPISKNLTLVNSNLFFSKIIFDELNNSLYLVSVNELWNYDNLGNLNLINTITDTIRDFIPLYNK